MLKFAAATSSNFKREFEVRNCLRHVAELKAKVDVSNHIVSGAFGTVMAWQIKGKMIRI